MQITNIHNAKTHFSKYIKMVLDGEEVIICSANKPVAKLVSYESEAISRTPGALRRADGRTWRRDGTCSSPWVRIRRASPSRDR